MADQCINGHCATGNEYKEQLGGIQYTLHSWWKRSTVHFPWCKNDDYVQHSFREHNQEADHMANLGGE